MPRYAEGARTAYVRRNCSTGRRRPKPEPDQNPILFWAEKAASRIAGNLDVLLGLASRDDAAGRALSIELASRIRRARDELREAEARLADLRAVPFNRRPTINRGPDEARIWIDDDVRAVV